LRKRAVITRLPAQAAVPTPLSHPTKSPRDFVGIPGVANGAAIRIVRDPSGWTGQPGNDLVSGALDELDGLRDRFEDSPGTIRVLLDVGTFS
jgi:hypothetical protein